MSKLTNKIALVTGASKGIGAAIAKDLGAAGATVAVNYASSKTGADKVVAEIVAAGGQAMAIQGDFTKPEDVARVFAEIKENYGRIDVLVNNAGVYGFGPVEQVTPEEFHRQFNLNVLGLLLSIKEASSLFGTDGGSIINIGSLVGKMSPPHSSIYSATKSAVDSITISLSKEFGPRKIRVNSVNPGLVETEGTTTAGMSEGDFANGVVKITPLGRIGQPEDIGPSVVFLASDEAGWVNGQLITVAGGATM